MALLFTSESVSEGHPDKVADQISDALLDAFLAAGPGQPLRHRDALHDRPLVVSGEVTTKAYVDVQTRPRDDEEDRLHDPSEQGSTRSPAAC